MTFLSVITPCYNEEANVAELHARVAAAMAGIPDCTYEHIFIDNASADRTVALLKELAAADPRVKIIVNARNFGHIRSPMHAFLQASGEAVISIVADLQDPPEMIPTLVAKWREGYSTVLCVKRSSEETAAMFLLRRAYYALVERLSSIETIQNFTGFGLYDRKVVEAVRSFGDPYPFFRGMIAEIGLGICKLPYDQPVRKRGITKNNFYTLYDIAMLGITNLSKVPLRLVTAFGFFSACLSFLAGFSYLVYKLIFWSSFTVGMAPLIIGLFFLGSVQLVSLGIIGEYVGAIHTQVQKRPYVIEKERIGF
ncbi:glycosyltransferase family 2 protein [Acidocella sp. KAb 2-4]|uniref:glycosyltransferase family 2 protein n=1 Tax=Acidocella sp. KAb 2-4 TaxID=2885158 RepID=UPI001D05C5C7|nr:glycosyltransferase family 2 protein [Acidocella sp. KAb 2-4]MCB5943648.1 glycosyltransferase family 2 protein [Acidocella sp. KAb 2-4]